MKNYFFAVLISIFAFSACRHKKEIVQITTITVPAKDKTAGSPAVDSLSAKNSADSAIQANNYRFIISFYSIGSGPDVQAEERFMAFIKGYENMTGLTLAKEATPWGREGEVDYCMQLAELKAEEQPYFIANLKIALADAKWVHYLENKPCRNKHN